MFYINVPAIKRSFTFKSPDMPDASLASEGDTWFKSDTKQAFSFKGGRWLEIPLIPVDTDPYKTAFIIGGVANTGFVADIDRYEFGNDSVSETGISLSVPTCLMSSFASASEAYASGGTHPGYQYSRGLTVLSFANEAEQSVLKALETPRAGAAGFNCSNRGYTSNGADERFGALNTIERLDFSSDTFSVVCNTDLNKRRCAGFNSITTGFSAGGCSGMFENTDSVNALTFTQDTYKARSLFLVSSRKRDIAACNSVRHGYLIGGYAVGGQALSTLDIAKFGSDMSEYIHQATLGSTLTGACGFNSKSHGFAATGLRNGDTMTQQSYRFEFMSDLSMSSTTVDVASKSKFNATSPDSTDNNRFLF